MELGACHEAMSAQRTRFSRISISTHHRRCWPRGGASFWERRANVRDESRAFTCSSTLGSRARAATFGRGSRRCPDDVGRAHSPRRACYDPHPRTQPTRCPPDHVSSDGLGRRIQACTLHSIANPRPESQPKANTPTTRCSALMKTNEAECASCRELSVVPLRALLPGEQKREWQGDLPRPTMAAMTTPETRSSTPTAE